MAPRRHPRHAASMNDHNEGEGVSPADLPAINRALFDHAIEAALSARDPCDDLGGFVEALWQQLAAAFEWQAQDWPEDVQIPQIGAAEPQPAAE